MAEIRDLGFQHSSPRSSSGGAESFKGTPDTHLTSFSPTEGPGKTTRFVKDLKNVSLATPSVRLPLSRSREGARLAEKDPFFTPVQSQTTKLSPTASNFDPNLTKERDFPLNGWPSIASALSNNLGISRHLIISANLSSNVPLTDIETWLNELNVSHRMAVEPKSISPVGESVFACFFDIRNASLVYNRLRRADSKWRADYIDASQCPCAKVSARSNVPAVADIPSGQVLLTAMPCSGLSHQPLRILDAAQSFIQSYGEVFAFVPLSTFPDGSFRAIIEFYNSSAALKCLSASNGIVFEGVQMAIVSYNIPASRPEELMNSFTALSVSPEPRITHNQSSLSHNLNSKVSLSTFGGHSMLNTYPFVVHPRLPSTLPFTVDNFMPGGPSLHVSSNTAPRTVIPLSYQRPPSPALTVHRNHSSLESLTEFGRIDGRRQTAPRVIRPSFNNGANHHNHVDVSRIRDGIDVRTTIMLRNIPNKVDQSMLKKIVDESSWGKYDFMYLRIDFANDCNVGYAFINFVDPLDIIDFVDARGNQRWNCFKSDKIAEISYATIQGKDCLVQKFRNSSVMLEAPHYRPKLYFTSNGPIPNLAGQEEPFPDPDNQSKMKRSCENAEHVGLFTPNAGQHFRDEQRRRRSQYDRGTRLAALEEYDYEGAVQRQQFVGAQSQ